MKKTLAAVLAAAMALSTATVAFAKDTGWTELESDDFVEGTVSDSTEWRAKMGKDTTYRIMQVSLDDGITISGDELSQALAEGKITAKVVITNGLDKLNGLPSLRGGKAGDVETGTTETETSYIWGADASGLQTEWSKVNGIGSIDMTKDKPVEVLCLDKDKKPANLATDVKYIYRKGTSQFNTAIQNIVANQSTDFVKEVTEVSVEKDPVEAVELKFKINHTYGTDSVKVAMKFRFTVKKKDVILGGKEYPKGDTLTSEEVKFKAEYDELDNYYEDMQLTKEELDDNRVILNGKELYDRIGDERFTIYFGDDVAAFSSKISSTQKKVNLYYKLDEVAEVTDNYPDIDFEFITFLGNSNVRFVNSGEMTFNAIGGKETAVYRWDGDAGELLLQPCEWNSTYNTVTIKGIKDLKGTFVVAEREIEVPDDEDNEPVDSAPIVEEPSSSEPSNDSERNPSTGAC